MEKEQKNSGNSGRTIFIVIIVLLLGLNGLLGYLYLEARGEVEVQTEKVDTLTTKRDSLRAELQDMLAQYDLMETNNDSLRFVLDSSRAQVEELLRQVERNKIDKWEISRLKKETNSLREIMKGYLVTIDSLNTLNIALREEKAEVEQELGQEKQRAQSLTSQKQELEQTVKIGSRLRALDIMATAQRVKSNGVHRETNRAERAEKIKCCFTLDVNEIAKPGKRKIYLRVIDPSGEVVADSQETDNMFKFNGVEGLYTTFRTEDYQNEELDVCISYELKQSMIPGDYVVELYADELDIGKGSFYLK